jgi:menaquinone-specific isochorismate synthase
MIDTEVIENIEIQDKFELQNIRNLLLNQLSQSDFSSSLNVQRIEISIPEINIIKWLGQQTLNEKIYWSERSGEFEIGGVGKADIITASIFDDYRESISLINKQLSSENKFLRYYGGFQFNKNEKYDELWKEFGNYYFILPLFEIIRTEDDYYFYTNIVLDKSNDKEFQIHNILNEFDKLVFNKHFKFPNTNDFLSRQDFPNKDGWSDIIISALTSINNHVVEKVVLARKVILKFYENLNIFSLLNKLKTINPFATHFCFQIKEDLAFLGGTPELLYQRNNGSIYSEAIAGTRPRGKNEFEDFVLERELLDSDKERREHAFVIESVKESLNNLCNDVLASKEVSVIKLRRLQHLYSKFHGKLKNNVSDIEILSALHPTPAVGGYPVNEALEQIQFLEPFQRGWYAAPVGWIGYNSAEFAVAIRSGLINGKNLALYSGSGIVDGSDINSEWQEIENKIGNFLKALGINGESNGKSQ